MFALLGKVFKCLALNVYPKQLSPFLGKLNFLKKGIKKISFVKTIMNVKICIHIKKLKVHKYMYNVVTFLNPTTVLQYTL